MSAKSVQDIQGYEFDWLACDGAGHVGFFSTAGGGYVPSEVLLDTDALDAAIQAILASAVSSQVRFAPSLKEGFENTWRMMAERGVFAFDADVHGRPYQRVAAPVNPMRVEDLPEPAAKVARLIILEDLDFSRVEVIPGQVLGQGR